MNYLRRTIQGDTLSLLLFVISVNPLSRLLEKHESYNQEKLIELRLFVTLYLLMT